MTRSRSQSQVTRPVEYRPFSEPRLRFRDPVRELLICIYLSAKVILQCTKQAKLENKRHRTCSLADILRQFSFFRSVKIYIDKYLHL